MRSINHVPGTLWTLSLLIIVTTLWNIHYFIIEGTEFWRLSDLFTVTQLVGGARIYPQISLILEIWLITPNLKSLSKSPPFNERSGDCVVDFLGCSDIEFPCKVDVSSRFRPGLMGIPPWQRRYGSVPGPQLFPFEISLLLFCQGGQALQDRISNKIQKRMIYKPQFPFTMGNRKNF